MLPGVVNSDGKQGFEWEPSTDRVAALESAIANLQEEQWRVEQWLEDNRRMIEDLEIDRDREFDALMNIEADLADLRAEREGLLYGDGQGV